MLNPVLLAIGAWVGRCRVDVCLSCGYRKGGPLAVTDANLLLGRLVPDYFPKIFGPTADEPLDAAASKTAFEELVKEINKEYGKEMGLDEVVYG